MGFVIDLWIYPPVSSNMAGKWPIKIGDVPIKAIIQFGDFLASHVSLPGDIQNHGKNGEGWLEIEETRDWNVGISVGSNDLTLKSSAKKPCQLCQFVGEKVHH